MSMTFATSEWTDAVWTALRNDTALASAGATWVHGPMLWQIEADGEAGFDQLVSISVDVHEGQVRDMGVRDTVSTPQWPFVFRASYAWWKAFASGDNVLLDGVLDGSVRFRGDVPTVSAHGDMFDVLRNAAAGIDTAFPDDTADTAAAAASR